METTFKAFGRAEFLAADDLPLTKVELPAELYGDQAAVYVRSLTGKDRAQLEKRFAKRDPQDAPGEFRATVLILTVTNADGSAMFTEDDRKALMLKNAGVLERIFTVACKVNGFTGKDVEELEKNSETSRDD